MSTLSPFLVLRVHSTGEVISISRPAEATSVNKAARERRRKPTERILGGCGSGKRRVIKYLNCKFVSNGGGQQGSSWPKKRRVGSRRNLPPKAPHPSTTNLSRQVSPPIMVDNQTLHEYDRSEESFC